MKGSGDVEVYGADNSGAKEGKISVYGSGDVCTRYLDIEDLEVNISGSAELKVHASKELEVNINGSGEVCYYGEANVTSNVSGSGEIYSCE